MALINCLFKGLKDKQLKDILSARGPMKIDGLLEECENFRQIGWMISYDDENKFNMSNSCSQSVPRK